MSAERRDKHRDERRREERRNSPKAIWNPDRRHQTEWKDRRDREQSRPRPPSNHGRNQRSSESNRSNYSGTRNSSEEKWRAEHPNHGRSRPVGEGGPWTSKMEACWLVLPDSELSKDGKLRERTAKGIYAEFDATDKGEMEVWNAKMLKHEEG